jgi:LysR family transcriptional regulator, regulator for bpeEF and oprC
MPTFIQYAAFVATVEQRSLAKAAKQLNLSPSAVSKQLSALENELGVTFLERTSRTVQITEAGRTFYARCKAILIAIRDAEEEAAATRDGMNGIIRLTVGTPFTRSALMSTLAEFSRANPDIRLHVNVTDEVEDLVKGRLDFAFRLGHLADNRLRAIPLFDVHPVFCAAPSYIKRFGKPERLADLRQHGVVLLSTLNLSAAMNRMFGQSDKGALNQKQHHFTNDVNAMYGMIAEGLCVGAMLDCSVRTEFESGKLIHLFPEKMFPGKRLSLVYAKQGSLPMKLSAFKDFVKQRMAS